MNQKELANILFPEITQSIESFLLRYPERNLIDTAEVTRFAPSPTGFLHIGGLFTALVSERVAHSTDGKFFMRIEDTDKKREVENGVTELVSALTRFGISIDESESVGGDYGPYLQSDRKNIYLAHAKYLISQGLAYPCFCTSEELEITREKQESLKIRPGYYNEWAVHRHLSFEDIERNLSEGKTFVIRMRSDLNALSATYKFTDEIKGSVSVTENDQDIVIIKSDGLPTYHLAHVVDDYLMRTTLVIRGDEWLSSLSIHLQLFRMFGWNAPKYAHLSPILKSENGNKRKLSKRKDPEAAVDYYLKEGYPNEAVIEYLLNIANSDFEDWRRDNPTVSNENFKIKLLKFSKSGALFDLNKLTNISKDVISRMSAREVYDLTLTWADMYDKEFAVRMKSETDYFIKIFSIERDSIKPRKDFGKWSDVKEGIFYFFDDMFKSDSSEPIIESESDVEIRKGYSQRLSIMTFPSTKEDWFADLKRYAVEKNYATDMKEFKNSPEKFKGSIGDIAMVLRIALTGRKQTPDLYEMIKVMGIEKVIQRLSV